MSGLAREHKRHVRITPVEKRHPTGFRAISGNILRRWSPSFRRRRWFKIRIHPAQPCAESPLARPYIPTLRARYSPAPVSGRATNSVARSCPLTLWVEDKSKSLPVGLVFSEPICGAGQRGVSGANLTRGSEECPSSSVLSRFIDLFLFLSPICSTTVQTWPT